MYKKLFKPFLLLGLFILIVGLACSAGSNPEPTPVPPTEVPPTEVPTEVPPTDVPTEVPTETPTEVPPTDVPLPSPTPLPPPTEEPTEVTEPEVPTFYIEEFDGSSSSFYPDQYYYWIQSGPDNFFDVVSLGSDYLSFNIDTESTYIYVYYGPWIYSDVRVGMEADNLGKNSQYVSLFCRYNPDRGWIEFNVAGDGTYSILAYNELEGTGYELIYNGGSTAIKIGKQTNVYVAECIGDKIALYVNDVEVRSMTIPNAFRFLDEGYVGLSIGSENSLPIIVDVNWFGIEAP